MSSDWKKLIPLDECGVGRTKLVKVDDHAVAVFHLANPDRFIVTRNECPHAGASLAAGELVDNVITCPMHQWQFDLDSGFCTPRATCKLLKFETKTQDGWLYACIPEDAWRRVPGLDDL